MLAHTQYQFLVFGACGHVSAYGLLSGCAHALLSMWVHACFFSAICNKRWALISFGDICGSTCHCICGYTLTIPPPHTLPYYPRTKHSLCPLSQLKTTGGGHPPSERVDKTYDWHATAPTFFVFMFIATCTMAHQDVTPGLAPSQHPCMQPHFPLAFSLPTPLHLVAISILAINCLSVTCCQALSLQPLRTELTSPQTPIPHKPCPSIQKSLGCTPLFPSPKSVRLWGVHRHHTGCCLVDVPFQSTLQTV